MNKCKLALNMICHHSALAHDFLCWPWDQTQSALSSQRVKLPKVDGSLHYLLATVFTCAHTCPPWCLCLILVLLHVLNACIDYSLSIQKYSALQCSLCYFLGSLSVCFRSMSRHCCAPGRAQLYQFSCCYVSSTQQSALGVILNNLSGKHQQCKCDTWLHFLICDCFLTT